MLKECGRDRMGMVKLGEKYGNRRERGVLASNGVRLRRDVYLGKQRKI
jgi:hypothetical protein